MPSYEKKRFISLPGTYDINVTPIQAIVDHPFFQLMRWRRQLGTTFLTFPSATHTRYEHSLGTYSSTCERTTAWRKLGFISERESVTLNIFGLLHDIGHGPFSHESEKVCAVDHNQNGLRLLPCLEEAVTKCGGDSILLKQLFLHQNPLHLAVSHHPCGTDKLDYLVRDPSHTNDALSFSLGLFINYTYLRDGLFAIDHKIAKDVMRLQEAYFYMYDRVYFRNSCLATRRMTQKMLYLLMSSDCEDEPLSEKELWGLTDDELLARFICSTNLTVKAGYTRLRERALPKVALVFRPKKYLRQEALSKKPIVVKDLPKRIIEDIKTGHGQAELLALEGKIAHLTGLPPYSIFVVPTVSTNRFKPAEIIVFDDKQNLGLLSEMFPKHFASLTELAETTVAFRVCTFKEYRETLATEKNACLVRDCLRESVTK